MSENFNEKLLNTAKRICEMREIMGYTPEFMAQNTDLSVEEYLNYEKGKTDFPFTFLHKCAQIFNIDINILTDDKSARLTSYTITRNGKGITTAKEDGIEIKDLAPMFRKKYAEPYFVKYEYNADIQDKPIHLTSHPGQEFDLIISGKLKVQIGEKIELLEKGDSIYYNSSTPHGMIAVDGKDCLFIAVVLPGEKVSDEVIRDTLIPNKTVKKLVSDRYVNTVEDKNGALKSIEFKNVNKFNFAFDIVDAIAKREPEKLAMIHISNDMQERRFTFNDMKRASNQTANYFKSIGIKKGDRVMLVLKRHYQFWYCMLALHKLGAVAIPATNQLQSHDFDYRFSTAEISAIVCTADGTTADEVDKAAENYDALLTKIMVGGVKDGWRDFDSEYSLYSTHFYRDKDSCGGDDPMLMYFTSGTSGYPKIAVHSYKYALGHYITAKYWHGVDYDGLHFTISDTGWGKAVWGKLYGQWLCEGAVFTYDFDRFDASKILPMFAKYNITTFCAPPTMLRMMIKQDISQYDFSSVKHMTTAGEALNPEVYRQFEKATGLRIMEGFGQTETTLSIANLVGEGHKLGSMGKPSPMYNITLLDAQDNEVADGEPGEICIDIRKGRPCGLFLGYYNDKESTDNVVKNGYYHTGDTAWRDEDGYLWYVGRVDDVIKSSGYRIGPFEIESVIMELPYVLECGVCAAPDPVRGQVVKACVVLVNGKKPSDELKKEIQDYVKTHTAPYKYPRIVEFYESLPKTVNGKIQRNLL